MNTKPFIKVGTKIIGVQHIIAIGKTPDGTVKLATVGKEGYFTFTGDEAAAVWEWAGSMLHCTDVVALTKGVSSHV